jgi:hypothetical protein
LCSFSVVFDFNIKMDSRGALISDRPSFSTGSTPGLSSFPSSRPIQTSNSGLSFGISSGGALDVPSLASAASIGNYKGVMLCNRPAPLDAGGKGASATGFGAGSDSLAPFTVSSSHETVHPFGQHRELQERWHAAQELRKHRPPNPLVAMIRADINRIAQKKADLQRQKAEEEARREKRKVELQESQRLLRELIRSQPMPDNYNDEEEDKESMKKKSTIAAYSTQTASSGIGGAMSAKVSKVKSAVAPAWARTESAINESEDEEVDNLVSFASNLDYDEYEGELEGKAGETLISKNLRAVEAEESAELAKLAAIEASEAKEEEKERRKERAVRRRRRARRERRRLREALVTGGHEEKKGDGEDTGYGNLDFDSGIEDENDNEDNEDQFDDMNDDMNDKTDANSLLVNNDTDEEETVPHSRPRRPDLDAESVAESMAAQGIRNVHSKKSLKTVINKVTAEVISSNGPKIIVHNEFKPAMEAAKGLVQNLPYANRNPAV